MTRRRALARHLAVLVALGAVASGLSSCASAREEIGTVNGECYLALPAALAAVHHHGRLEGVRLVSAPWLRARAPRLFAAVREAGTRSGAVCLVAFGGAFAPAQVERGVGDASGTVAIVELGFPAKQLFGTVVLPRAPFDFAHSRA